MLKMKKYADLVQSNGHGKVLEEIAKDFQLNHYAKVFQSINNIHNFEGYLSYDVLQLRTRIKQDLFDYLERTLSSEDYKKLKELI